MVGTTIITILCAAGIAFYVRFIVALCKEYSPWARGYWALLRLGTANGEVVELQTRKPPMKRAA
jgi:hypothetical protein